MRISVIGAVGGGSLAIGRAINIAFQQLGMASELVDFSDLQTELNQLKAAGDDDCTNLFLRKCQERLVARLSAHQPEVVFGIAQSPLFAGPLLRELKKSGIKMCYWFVENYRHFDYWRQIAPLFDHFFAIQDEPFRAELQALGCTGHYYLPLAFDPELESGPVGETASIPVSFVGAPYANRVHFFARLARDDFSIYGEGWSTTDNPAVKSGGERVSLATARGIYRRTLVNLNLHSYTQPSWPDGDFVNPRTFELAGLGVFQLTDMRQLLPRHFDPGREVIALRDWGDMAMAINYFLEHPHEREAIAQRAQAVVMGKHTYLHRAREIIEHLTA